MDNFNVQDIGAATRPKVDAETAAAEFERFADMMALDIDTSGLDDEDRADLGKIRRQFERAVMAGLLVVNENGEPVYTPNTGDYREAITFYEPTGADKMAMDAKKKGHDMAKTYAMIAAQTKVHAKVFAGMPNRHLKVCEGISLLFFA